MTQFRTLLCTAAPLGTRLLIAQALCKRVPLGSSQRSRASAASPFQRRRQLKTISQSGGENELFVLVVVVVVVVAVSFVVASAAAARVGSVFWLFTGLAVRPASRYLALWGKYVYMGFWVILRLGHCELHLLCWCSVHLTYLCSLILSGLQQTFIMHYPAWGSSFLACS